MRTPAVARMCLITGLLLGTVAGTMAAPPRDLATPQHVLAAANPGTEWTGLLARLRPDKGLEARFHERRENDFRRGHRIFQGRLRLWEERGVSLHYEGILNVTLVAAPGVVWRRPGDGDWSAYPAAAEDGMGAWANALWRLEFTELEETFELYGRFLEDETWELLLSPREDPRLPRLYLTGDDQAMTRLEVTHSPRRRTVFQLLEVDRDPDMEGWEAYFPPPE